MMPALVSAAGIALSLGFICLSAAINWRYGLSLARDPIDQMIYSATSVLCDLAKATTPFFFWWALRIRRLLPMILTVVMWGACTAYSITSAAGFVELTTAMQTGAITAKQDLHAELEVMIKRKRDQLAALDQSAPSVVVTTRLDGMKRDGRFVSSKFYRLCYSMECD